MASIPVQVLVDMQRHLQLSRGTASLYGTCVDAVCNALEIEYANRCRTRPSEQQSAQQIQRSDALDVVSQ